MRCVGGLIGVCVPASMRAHALPVRPLVECVLLPAECGPASTAHCARRRSPAAYECPSSSAAVPQHNTPPAMTV